MVPNGKRDEIRYVLQPDGVVLMTHATPVEDGPALGKFLDFLERDIAAHPERVRAVGSKLAARIRSLMRGVHVDLDARLPADDQ